MITTIQLIHLDQVNKEDVDEFKLELLELLKASYTGDDPAKLINIENMDKIEINFRDKLIVITH